MKTEGSNIKLVKDTLFLARINSRIKDAFNQLAEQKGISMSEYFDRLLMREFREQKVKIEVTEKIC